MAPLERPGYNRTHVSSKFTRKTRRPRLAATRSAKLYHCHAASASGAGAAAAAAAAAAMAVGPWREGGHFWFGKRHQNWGRKTAPKPTRPARAYNRLIHGGSIFWTQFWCQKTAPNLVPFCGPIPTPQRTKKCENPFMVYPQLAGPSLAAHVAGCHANASANGTEAAAPTQPQSRGPHPRGTFSGRPPSMGCRVTRRQPVRSNALQQRVGAGRDTSFDILLAGPPHQLPFLDALGRRFHCHWVRRAHRVRQRCELARIDCEKKILHELADINIFLHWPFAPRGCRRQVMSGGLSLVAAQGVNDQRAMPQ